MYDDAVAGVRDRQRRRVIGRADDVHHGVGACFTLTGVRLHAMVGYKPGT